MTYIAVTVPAWEPVGESPPRATGITKPPAPEGAGVGGGASSLVPSLSTTHTKSSDICLSALEKLDQLPYTDKRSQYQDLCSKFYEYLEMCEHKGFSLKGYDTKEGKIRNVPLEYDNRWMPGRRKELSKKLSLLEAWFDDQKNRPVTMITLTSYHDGLTIGSAWFELNKSRDKLLKLIRKYYGDVDYFWVPEPHKSGYVHYHMAVFADVSNEHDWWVKKDGIDWYRGRVNIEDKFRDLWSRKYKTGNHTYGLDFSQKKNKDDKIQHLKNYLSKYLEKGFLIKEWSIGLLLFNAHLWETGFRMYGASKRISAIMKIPENKNQKVVWLETMYLDYEKIPDSEEKIETERVIWYRQYIPEWLDSPLWCSGFEYSWIDGGYYEQWTHRWEPDDTIKLYDWGRRQKGTLGYDPTHGCVKYAA